MEDTKLIEKKLTRIVERFTTSAVGYENQLKTLDQLRNSACNSIALLKSLQEIEGIAVGELVDDFTSLIHKEDDELKQSIESVCGKLYDFINKNKS